MATNQPDLLQKFIDNEKKSKTWTLISVVIFILLTGVIVSQAYKLKKNSEILYSALVRADSLNNANEENKSSLENVTKTAELLQLKYDSLLATIPPKVVTIIDTVAVKKAKYTVYIQYIDTYTNESRSVFSILRRNNYSTPGRELMPKHSFASSVKYFNDADKQEAQRIASLINSNVPRFSRKPIRILKNNTNVPGGQLEVWLGEVKTIRPTDIVEQYKVQERVKQ